ncbi:NAD(P)/FAD-dependent oxidoreductase [Leptolyngbya sp. AN02str]|uniref:NAD(P)/FAD-dependent oxidoreductase n=1 Tax=Leptolyngbya sp. AN02str TaxID=3423363 RepID=UPI003D31D0BE
MASPLFISNSFWLTDGVHHHQQTTAQLPSAAEVVVIGGGISGVSTAYWLSQMGLEVVLLEQRGLAGGATGRNGGHLALGTNRSFGNAIATYGYDAAWEIWQFTQQVVEQIQQFIHQHQIQCDLRMNSFASLAQTEAEAEALQQSFEWMQKAGLDVEFWDGKQAAEHTHSSRFLAGWHYQEHGQIWPAKLVVAIAQVAMEQGALIHTHTPVEAVEAHGNGFSVYTPQSTIQAQAIVHATNAHARRLRPILQEIIVPVRGQALVTQPVPRLWEFDWITNYGYEYGLQRVDGRIVFGGMRWRSPTMEWDIEDDSQIHPTISQQLREFLPATFDALRDVQIQQEWTGIMAFSPDDNPLIGALPGYPNEFIIAGYSGHGMTIAFGAGRAIARMVAGYPPELPSAFFPDRFSQLQQPMPT